VPEFASELYRPSDRRLMAKLVPTFGDRGCCVVSAKDPQGRILDFLDRCSYYLFQVAHKLYTGGWVGPVPDPLLLRKSGIARIRTLDLWIYSQVLWPLDHRGGHSHVLKEVIFMYWLGTTKENYEKFQSWLVSTWLRFEPSTSLIQVCSVECTRLLLVTGFTRSNFQSLFHGRYNQSATSQLKFIVSILYFVSSLQFRILS
jgi:hypothetical protein